ncbi:hypothetical protein ASPZODRAFT_12236 [Penicilliopsis zonata CBS 506.65]|uniref:Uncharacterized protein n=1 Tax=Penicilliopsis zonata CBS 506.65 TaxID=1073090 RepID=A0A1L9SW34_9EURO|nr:hypothetical protein ASPZODRAFT_12236 [Penicilliopsis zonata CBS 506.65]OJJ51410.1 hypothetical protein ASPZODRAFT_12236 [Penicilliopsis zonata CBS 506.65]
MTPTSLPQQYRSPKRKRSGSESDYFNSPSASPQSTVSINSFHEARLREEEDGGRYSPRAAVAGHLGRLAIRGENLANTAVNRAETLSKDTEGALSLLPGTTRRAQPEELLPEEALAPRPLSDAESMDALTQPPENMENSPSKKKALLQPSPRKKQDKSRRASSPPITSNSNENPMVWHDSEITGHNPSDPSDDGYGINGIGFKPTAAVAWARSQKRQKQVAEWKNREARDARGRRRERREGVDSDKLRAVQNGAIQKRVKFDL